MLEILLSTLPIGLGVVVLKRSIFEFNRPRRKNDKIIIALGGISSFILIMMQCIWFYIAYVVKDTSTVQVFSSIWSIYHSLLMTVMIMFTSPRQNYNKD